MSNKITRTTLTNKQRLHVLKYKDSNPNASYVNVANWVKTTLNVDIHPTTIGRLLKRKDNIEGLEIFSKRSRTVQHPELENAMYEWVIQYQPHVTLNNAI
jgi:hypothetical protein